MVGVNQTTSIITLNARGLNTLIERQRFKKNKNQYPPKYVLCSSKGPGMKKKRWATEWKNCLQSHIRSVGENEEQPEPSLLVGM